jgi:Holliday junction resolvasome RuvABC endonuclease subunit
MRSLSLDQATLTGWCVMQDNELIDYGTFDMNDEVYEPEIISQIKKWLEKMINTYKPEDSQIFIISLEDVQMQQNAQTFKFLSKLLGVLENFLYENDMDYAILPPGTWRNTFKFKGRKREVLKPQAQKYVTNTFGINVTEDEADAICQGSHIHIQFQKRRKK